MNFSLLKARVFRNTTTIDFNREINVGKAASQRNYFEAKAVSELPPGWVVVRVRRDRCKHVSESFLFLSFGYGYEEAERYPLNCLNGEMCPSVMSLPQGIKSIRLVIIGDDVENTQITLDFIPICKPEALVRIAFYLYRINKLRGISTLQVLQEKWHQIRKAGVLNIIRNLGSFYDYADTERPLGYQQWIERTERLDTEKRNRILTKEFPYSPLITVICRDTQDYNLLEKTLQSLQLQTYKNWQLHLIIDPETTAEFKQEGSIFTSDNRMVFHALKNPTSTSHDVSFFDNLQGGYVLWVNPGDTLSPFALFYWIDAINQQPDMVAWYCDSDQVNSAGERDRPHFRPRWNRKLFYSQNYINTCCLFQSESFRGITDKVKCVEGAEQYDLFLQYIEQGLEEKIGHIPKVLYHFHSEKHADLSQNNEMAAQERNALCAHFNRMGQSVSVSPGKLPGVHHLKYSLPAPLPRVTIIIPTRDQVKILKQCIKSLLQFTRYPDYNIIVVNNGSDNRDTFAYFDAIKTDSRIRILDYDKPFNFAAINNYAVNQTDAELVCLLNNDMEIISAEWLEEMVRYGVQNEVGCVGAKLLFANGTVQHAGAVCGLGHVAGHAHKFSKRDDPGYFGRLQSAQYYSAVTAACLLVRKEIYQQVGGMNENLAVAYNDIDFCLKVKKAGYKNIYTPYAELYHHESLSRGAEDTEEKKERYQQEVDFMWENWKNELENDNCYNPNLSRLREDFSL